MPKFKVGDWLEAVRSGSQAIISAIDYKHNTYTLKYSDKKYAGVHVYDCFEVERNWSLVPNSQLKKTYGNRVCTCGIWKTYGQNIQLSFHSDYCDLLKH